MTKQSVIEGHVRYFSKVCPYVNDGDGEVARERRSVEHGEEVVAISAAVATACTRPVARSCSSRTRFISAAGVEHLSGRVCSAE